MRHITKDFSDQGLGIILADLLKNGLSAAIPVNSDILPFSLIVISPENELCRLAIKYRKAQRGKIEIQYKEDALPSFDATAVYCPNTQSCYYINNNEVKGKTVILRLDEPERISKATKLAYRYTDPQNLFESNEEQSMLIRNQFDLKVTSNGNYLPVYDHKGKLWVEAEEGNEFELVVRNNTEARSLFVMSVDGKNIVTGEKASKEGQGYILAPYQISAIEGWRTSNFEIAKFVFTVKENSYSSKVGDGTSNCGVIGGVVFKEKRVVRRDTNLSVTCDSYNPNNDGSSPRGVPMGSSDRGVPISDCEPTGGVNYSANCSDAGESTRGTTIATSNAMGAGFGFGGPIGECMDETEVKTSASLDLHSNDYMTQEHSLSFTGGEAEAAATFGRKALRSKKSVKKSADPSYQMGAGFGKKQSSVVREAPFERVEPSAHTFVIHYDSRENLIKRGIITAVQEPNPFPADNKFCPEPV
jgi:hypothetical protein